MIFGIVFTVLLLALIMWLSTKYFILTGSNRIALQAFNMIHEQINKRYELLLNSLNSCVNNPDLTSETKNLISKALDFNLKKDSTERIIRFANAIFDNAEKLSLSFEEDKEFDSAKKHYNDCAKNLKHYVDVFPTSLMARMSKIKFLDYLR